MERKIKLSLQSFAQDNGSRLNVEQGRNGEKRIIENPSAFTFTCVLFKSALFKVFSVDAISHKESVAHRASICGTV